MKHRSENAVKHAISAITDMENHEHHINNAYRALEGKRAISLDKDIVELADLVGRLQAEAKRYDEHVQQIADVATPSQLPSMQKLMGWGWKIGQIVDGVIQISRPSRKEQGVINPDGSYSKV